MSYKLAKKRTPFIEECEGGGLVLGVDDVVAERRDRAKLIAEALTVLEKKPVSETNRLLVGVILSQILKTGG